MRIWPVFLDCTPRYQSQSGASLLQMPLGSQLLVSRLCERVRAVTANPPVIVPPPGVLPAAYRATMSVACPGALILGGDQHVIDAFPSVETSDAFLIVDPRCLPLDAPALTALRDHFHAGRSVAHHLVAFEGSISGTKESVSVDGDGRVRSIHRHYEATWPFVAGVAVSLVPVTSSLRELEPLSTSLEEVRRHLVSRGAPCHDVTLDGVAVDLTTPHGLLSAAEHYVLAETSHARAATETSTLLVGEGHTIAPTARIIGPVVIHSGVHIGENAIVVGPALIGAGAQVCAGAVVAHAFLAPQSKVPPGWTLRDRVWFDDPDDSDNQPWSYEDRLERLSIDREATSAIGATDLPPSDGLSRAKRVFDIVVSLCALVLFAPVFLLVAILIRRESRGPVFYRGEREGLRGRPFQCLKFRTMQEGADGLQHVLKARDKLDGPHFKLDQDPRLTRIGGILRSTNLDELPQLINVLRGEMSLVGPRPSPFRENQICLPWREGRLSVRPGLTGLWQVCRRNRSSGDFHQWIEYDLLYVQQASFWLDIKILVATLVTVAGGGAVPPAWLVRIRPPLRPPSGVDVEERSYRPAPSPVAEGARGRSSPDAI